MLRWLSRRRYSSCVTGLTRPSRPVVIEAVEKRQLLAISVKFVNVPISAAAKAADPTLNNLRTVDVQLTVSAGDDWLASDLLLRLTKGSFYNPRAGGNAPKPDEWADNPALEFDTFVSGPGFASPTILGRKEGSGAAIFSATEVNVAWGDLVTTGAGVFTAARLTMTNDAAGDLTGVLYAKSAPATAKPYAAQIKPQATTGTITGYVFNDQDANGGKGATEPKLPNWQVYIDGNNNGRLDSGERSVKTRSNGNFTISDVPAGTHRLRLVLQSGWRRTAPANSSFSHNVTVTAGATAANKKFGVTQQGVSTSQRVASVQGRVVALPSHARAITEEDLKPLSGWRVFIDRNNDGRFAVGEENTRTDSEGRFTFANLQPGTYRLRLTQVEGFAPFEPQNNLITVVLGAGQVSSGHTFSQKAV